MVFSGGGDTTDNDGMKPLHNFDLPCLKWGNQKVLRCMNVDRKMKSVVSDDGDHGGDTTVRFREKLMIDFQTEVGKMKDAILRGGGGYPSPAPVSHIPATVMMTSSSSPASDRPWNLRTRRGAVLNNEITKPARNDVIGGGGGSGGGGGYGGGDVSGTTSGEKREREKEMERAKFSISISRREIEEDFAVMSGRRLPRKPKKRPRYIQKQLDTLFPGLWLSEITADLYRVPDDV
ncbi:hypothetical protein CTI12_AA092920 [Artemisia annua]|uniref:DUF1639 family protein n=1 Tax=Artemisia annua TaxID=35608 RepID=A0A2U1PZW5_ARTAN|nr:hypothetical protein CTI12_AA092920 [Artemisia annua]